MSDYKPINPNDFTVYDAISHLNSNIDYLYNLSQSIDKVDNNKANLIPYSDFTINSNLDYWLPYKNSNLILKEDSLVAYSLDKVVGIISPVINTQLIPNKDYTVVLKTHSNKVNSVLNEAYLQRSDLSSIKLNIDTILEGDITTYYLHFKISEYIKEFRLILGIGTTIENSLETFKYENVLLRSKYIQDNLLIRKYDINSGIYDNNDLIQSLYYMLITEDYTPLDTIMSFFSEDEIPSTKTGVKYSLLETLLLDLIKIKLEVQGVSRFQNAHKPIFDFIGIIFNTSHIKGLIPLSNGSKVYSLINALYVLDIIELWIDNKGNYVTNNYNLLSIKESILLYIDENIQSLIKDDFILGAINTDKKITYNFLDNHNQYSSSVISLFFQVELSRLLIKCNQTEKAQKCLEKVLTYKLSSKALLPSTIRYGGSKVNDTEVSISTICLIINLLKHYPGLLEDSIHDLTTHVKLLECDKMFLYDYTSNSTIYTSNQFMTKLLDDIQYIVPNIFTIKNLALYEGSISDKDILTNPNNSIKDVANRLEAVLENSDLESRLVQVEFSVTDTAIIASVTSSREWQSLNDTIETNATNVLNKVDLALSQLTVNTQGILNKVSSTNITEVLKNVTILGDNLINNSLFIIKDYQDWQVSNKDNIGILCREDGKIYLQCVHPGTQTIINQTVSSIQKDIYALSFEAYGNGTIELIISNGKDLVKEIIQPSISSTRYTIPITITTLDELSINITLKNETSLQIGYLTLCKGNKSLGYHFNDNDFSLIREPLTIKFNELQKTINSPSIKVQNEFYLEGITWCNLALILLQHKAIISTTNTHDLTLALNKYINSIYEIRNYINNNSDLQSFEVLSTYTATKAILLDTLVKCNSTIKAFRVDLGGDKVEQLIRKDFQDINTELDNLYTTLLNIFEDSILLEEEKPLLDTHYANLVQYQLNLEGNLQYFEELLLDDSNTDLIDLYTLYNTYLSTYRNLLTQLTLIINADAISQDMRYLINGYILTLQEDELLKEQFLKLYSKYNNEKLNSCMSTLIDIIDSFNLELNNLSKEVIDSLEDSSISYLEKSHIETALNPVKQYKLDLDVELGYYITQLSIDNTSELSSLKATYNLFTVDYLNIIELLDSILENNIIETTLETWTKCVQSLETSSESLANPVQKALQQIITKSHDSYIEDILYNIKQVTVDLNNLIALIYELSEEGFSSSELQYLGEYLVIMDNNRILMTNELSALSFKSELLNTLELKNMNNSIISYNTIAQELLDNMRNLMTINNLTDNDYNLLLQTDCKYRKSLIDLQVSIVDIFKTLENNKTIDNTKIIETLNNNLFNSLNSFKTILDENTFVVFKQKHLEILKQVSLYLDNNITPELIGNHILFTLDDLANTLKSNFNNIEKLISDNITDGQKQELLANITIYEGTLSSLVNSLKEASNLIGQLDTSEGNIYSLIKRLSSAELKITDEAIISVVESKSTMLVKQDEFNSLTERVQTAESKLTKDGLTTIIGDSYITEEDVNSKGYATESEVTQTSIEILNKFSSSGGYNLLKNTGFFKGIDFWTELTQNTVTIDSVVVYKDNNSVKIEVPAGGENVGIEQTFATNVLAGIDYRLTFYYYFSDNTFNGPLTLSINGVLEGESTATIIHSETLTKSDLVAGSWNKLTTMYTTTNNYSNLTLVISMQQEGIIYLSSIMLTEGELEQQWSPHNAEVYGGLTKIDANGIEITMSESGVSLGTTTITYEGVATYDKDFITKAYFGRDNEAFIDKLRCNTINAGGLPQYNTAELILYVNQNSSGFPDGLTLNTAFTTIQAAIDYIYSKGMLLEKSITIYVSNGFYAEDIQITNLSGSGRINLDLDTLVVIEGAFTITTSCKVTINGNKSSLSSNNGAVLKCNSNLHFNIGTNSFLVLNNVNLYNPNAYAYNTICLEGVDCTINCTNVDFYKYNTVLQGDSITASINSVGYAEVFCNVVNNSTINILQSLPTIWEDSTLYTTIQTIKDVSSIISFIDVDNNAGTPSAFDPQFHPALSEYTTGMMLTNSFQLPFTTYLYHRGYEEHSRIYTDYAIIGEEPGTKKYYLACFTIPEQLVTFASKINNITVTITATRVGQKGDSATLPFLMYADKKWNTYYSDWYGIDNINGNGLSFPYSLVDTTKTQDISNSAQVSNILSGNVKQFYIESPTIGYTRYIAYWKDVYLTVTGTLK